MKKHGLVFFLIFGLSLFVSLSFQSCGSSSIQSADSENGGLPIEVIPDDPNNESTGNGTGSGGSDGGSGGGPGNGNGNGGNGTGELTFALANGDNVFYQTFNNSINVLSTVRLLAKSFYTMFETHVYESSDVNITTDLPASYCSNSALPHCAHLNPFVCLGYGCFEGPEPVRCHWQKRLSTADQNNTFPVLNTMVVLNRQVTPDDPMIDGCNDPLMSFFKENSSIIVSLANRACVPDGMAYATGETAPNVIDVFDAEIEDVEDQMSDTGGAEYCNNYSAYHWSTTKFSYASRSGFVPADQSFFYEVDYEGQRANMRWKVAGDDQIYCAVGVPVQPGDLNELFPDAGISYEVFRTNTVIADLPTAEITYEDPVDGGSVWRFFLNQGTAMTHSGGAIMDSTQAQAIQQMIETVLVNRAGTFNLTTNCN